MKDVTEGPIRFEMADIVGQTSYSYNCSDGHVVASHKALQACPSFVRGQACTGTLTRVGKGSRGPRKPDAG